MSGCSFPRTIQSLGLLTEARKEQECKFNKKGNLKNVLTHPSRKNKDAARVGHPEFHSSRVGEAGGELECGKISLFPSEELMLAKVTVKNQLTLPKAVMTRFTGVEYFDVSTDGASIVLRPLQRSRAEEVRLQLTALGIDERDVAAAVEWAREAR